MKRQKAARKGIYSSINEGPALERKSKAASRYSQGDRRHGGTGFREGNERGRREI